MAYKQCPKCNILKSFDSFNKSSSNTTGRESYCKPCKKVWRYENKDRIKALQKTWRLVNIEHDKAYRQKYYKEYFKKNPKIRNVNMRNQRKKESFKTWNREYQKKRMENPVFRLQNRLRARISMRLRKLGISKLGSAIKDVGCTLGELKNHLEALFTFGMTWENYGKWHVDHIKPLISFNLDNPEEFKKAVHFTNLQPLWAIDNYIKGTK